MVSVVVLLVVFGREADQRIGGVRQEALVHRFGLQQVLASPILGRIMLRLGMQGVEQGQGAIGVWIHQGLHPVEVYGCVLLAGGGHQAEQDS